MAYKITVRQERITKGRKRLYLDIYPPIPHPKKIGKTTRRESLGLYVFEKTSDPLNKLHNKNTIQLAEQIRQLRINELNKPEIYSVQEKENLAKQKLGELDFVEYFKSLARKKKESNQSNYLSTLKYLMEFTGGSVKVKDLNESYLERFKEYLLTTKSNKSDKVKLKRNSAVSYFNKVKAALKSAYKEGILSYDLNSKISSIKPEETHRMYVTLEELNKLVKTECKDELLKRAALFSALTGLRFSDIQKLVWGEIEYSQELGYVIKFHQKKTEGAETLPISEQAFKLLGDRRGTSELVIDGLEYSAYKNKQLSEWVTLAGIDKKITFHCFRHTYATLQLANGTDIYTVSKLLGHKDLKTTQIYAKTMDQAKRAAADRIKLDL